MTAIRAAEMEEEKCLKPIESTDSLFIREHWGLKLQSANSELLEVALQFDTVISKTTVSLFI